MPHRKITKLDRKPGLYLQHTATKGRGLFCTSDIKAGERLEVTPAIIMNDKESPDIEDTILADYVFKIGKMSKWLRKHAGVKKIDDVNCVVMGITSYCNHDENPNAEVLWDEENGSLLYILEATRFIPKHTEICTSYGDEWFADR